MDYTYIEQLLERYWSGQTNLEEEQILRTFFSQPRVPDSLAHYAPLFALEQQAATIKTSATFDVRLEAALQAEARKHTSQQPTNRIEGLKAHLTHLLKAAAAVAIIITIGSAAEQATRIDETRQTQSASPTALPNTYVRSSQVEAIVNPQAATDAGTLAAQNTDSLTLAPIGGERSGTAE